MDAQRVHLQPYWRVHARERPLISCAGGAITTSQDSPRIFPVPLLLLLSGRIARRFFRSTDFVRHGAQALLIHLVFHLHAKMRAVKSREEG